MAKEVELSTVKASKEIKRLRDEIVSLAKELGASSDQIKFISKAMTGSADAARKFETRIKQLESQVDRLNKTAQASQSAWAKQTRKLSEQKTHYENLRRSIKAYVADSKQSSAMQGRLTREFNKYSDVLKSRKSTVEQVKAAEESWRAVSRKIASELKVEEAAVKATAAAQKKATKDTIDLTKAQADSEIAMARQVKEAVAIGQRYEYLATQIEQLKLKEHEQVQLLVQLTSAFHTYDAELRTSQLDTLSHIKAQTEWNKVAGDTANAITGIKTERANRGLSALSEFLQDAGSSAVLALGPLSGVGARLISLNAIITRSNIGWALAAGTIVGIGTALVKIGTSAARTGIAFEKIEGTLRAATGSMGAAKQEFGFVVGITEELGNNLESSAAQFAKLAAAARGSSLEGQGARDIFEGVSVAAAALRLNTEQTTGALRAIEQMISKGNVQAEELRGQLGERLPGAFQLAAKAMGVSTKELNNMLQRGDVLAEDLLPKLAKLLKETFGSEALTAAGTFTAQIEKLKTEVTLLLDEIEDRNDILKTLASLGRIAERTVEDLRGTSPSDQFALMVDDLNDAKARMDDLVERGKDLSDLDATGLKRYKEDFQRTMTELQMKSDETSIFVREKLAEMLELEGRGQLRGEELKKLEELKDFFDEIGKGSVHLSGNPIDALLTTGLHNVIDLWSKLSGENISIPDLLGVSSGKWQEGIDGVKQYKERLAELLDEIMRSDDLSELRLEVEELGKSELQKDLGELNRRLEDIVATIKSLETPQGISKEVFEDIKTEAIETATKQIDRLKQETEQLYYQAKALDVGAELAPDKRDKIGGTIEDVAALNEELMEAAKIQDEIHELGMTMSQVLATGASAAADEYDKLGGTIDSLRLEESQRRIEETIKKQIAWEEHVKKLRREMEELGHTLSWVYAIGQNIPADPRDKMGGSLSAEEVKQLNRELEDTRKKADKAAEALKKFREAAEERFFENVGKSGVTERVSKFDKTAEASETLIELSNKRSVSQWSQRDAVAEELKDLERANIVLQQRIAGNTELADMTEARFELMKKFPDLNTAELKELQLLLEKNKELIRVYEEQQELEKVRKELAQDFAQSIGQAFEDAVIEGEKLSNVLQALLDDIQRIILRVTVTKPLENLLTGIFTGEDMTGSKAGPGGTPFFGGVLGGLFTRPEGEASKTSPRFPGPLTARAGGLGTSVAAAPERSFGEILNDVLGIGNPGSISEFPEAARKSKAELEGLSTAAASTSGTMEGRLGSSLESLIVGKVTERVTTETLSASLFGLKAAADAAAAALYSVAGAGGGGGGGGALASLFGSGRTAGLSSITNFSSSFGGDPGMPFGGQPPNFVPGFGFTGPRAGGGPTGPNSPVLVGEEGPEVFMPNRSGVIQPMVGGTRAVQVNLTQNIHTDSIPEFRRSQRSNLRSGAKLLRSSLRRM